MEVICVRMTKHILFLIMYNHWEVALYNIINAFNTSKYLIFWNTALVNKKWAILNNFIVIHKNTQFVVNYNAKCAEVPDKINSIDTCKYNTTKYKMMNNNTHHDGLYFADSFGQMACEDGNNTYLLSKLCVNGSGTENLECIQNYNDITYLVLRKLLGIWSVLVGGLGISGNLLTLLAIPYAARRKR